MTKGSPVVKLTDSNYRVETSNNMINFVSNVNDFSSIVRSKVLTVRYGTVLVCIGRVIFLYIALAGTYGIIHVRN